MNNALKFLLCLIIPLISSFETAAQSPDKINYQAVARNTSTGVELSNQEVYVVVKILADNPKGDIVYQEDHQNIQTNLFGLFNLQIGNGTPVSGSFSELNWQENSYWLEIDLDAGQGLKTLGTMEFVSVPYALHAKTATYIDDADADPTNELVVDFTFNENNRELTIVQEGENKTVGIGSVDDADADPYNEIIENWNFADGILTFQEAGNDYSLDLTTLNVDDADSDPDNERIDEGYPQLNGKQLDISEGGILYSVDLSPLNAWNESDEVIYTPSKRVGVGTDTPTSQLTVKQTASAPSEIFRVENDQSDAALSVEDHKVGLAGETGANHVQLHGSVGYSTKVLDAGANYTLQPEDFFIACRLLTNNDVHISMPDPAGCPGRMVYITRINKASSGSPKVHINWNGHQLNFSTGNTILPDGNILVFTNRIAVISLGEDGWATID